MVRTPYNYIIKPGKSLVEGIVEETNWSKDDVKVVWEILPDEDKHVFREITLEDIDPSFLCPGYPIDSDNFPTLPHPVLDMATDCLDRVWTKSIIEIRTESPEADSEKDQEEIKIFDINENHKGLVCPFNLAMCQEGWCQGCIIYRNQSI
jgi:hypothetical protein